MNELPSGCEVALKEWDGICRALLEGRQCVLLRKGGIEEEAGVFSPEHADFWLYPTHVHQAEQGIRESPTPTTGSTRPAGPAEPVELRGLAHVERVARVQDLDVLTPLAPFHVWTEETIARRFHYRRPGLWVLVVRVFRRDPPVHLVPTPEQLGCKSWVTLQAPFATTGAVPVVAEADWEKRLRTLSAMLSWDDAHA
jgi:hypothetical protein